MEVDSPIIYPQTFCVFFFLFGRGHFQVSTVILNFLNQAVVVYRQKRTLFWYNLFYEIRSHWKLIPPLSILKPFDFFFFWVKDTLNRHFELLKFWIYTSHFFLQNKSVHNVWSHLQKTPYDGSPNMNMHHKVPSSHYECAPMELCTYNDRVAKLTAALETFQVKLSSLKLHY